MDIEGNRRKRGHQKKLWVDNVKQWTGLSLPVLLDTAQDIDTEGERRRRGRQRKLWTDNVKQWTGPDGVVARSRTRHQQPGLRCTVAARFLLGKQPELYVHCIGTRRYRILSKLIRSGVSVLYVVQEREQRSRCMDSDSNNRR